MNIELIKNHTDISKKILSLLNSNYEYSSNKFEEKNQPI